MSHVFLATETALDRSTFVTDSPRALAAALQDHLWFTTRT
jgi:hypothetical protein